MQTYEIGLYLLTAARALIVVLWFSARLVCSVHVAKWYEQHGIVDTPKLAIGYLRHLVFCTATIYCGKSWPWLYWYRHVQASTI